MKRVKTTKEIVDDYNHKAPDSLLCGDEKWVSLDELQAYFKKLEKDYQFKGSYSASELIWHIQDELFLSPQASPLPVKVTENKEGGAKDIKGISIPIPSLALPNCDIKNSQHSCCLAIKELKKLDGKVRD